VVSESGSDRGSIPRASMKDGEWGKLSHSPFRLPRATNVLVDKVGRLAYYLLER